MDVVGAVKGRKIFVTGGVGFIGKLDPTLYSLHAYTAGMCRMLRFLLAFSEIEYADLESDSRL